MKKPHLAIIEKSEQVRIDELHRMKNNAHRELVQIVYEGIHHLINPEEFEQAALHNLADLHYTDSLIEQFIEADNLPEGHKPTPEPEPVKYYDEHGRLLSGLEEYKLVRNLERIESKIRTSHAMIGHYALYYIRNNEPIDGLIRGTTVELATLSDLEQRREGLIKDLQGMRGITETPYTTY
jgi:hypothetical protein